MFARHSFSWKIFYISTYGNSHKQRLHKKRKSTIKRFLFIKGLKNYSQKKDSVTIKNLLTMSSAFEGSDMNQSSPGNEENMYPTDNCGRFLNLPMDSSKLNGKQWDYFTAGVIFIGNI